MQEAAFNHPEYLVEFGALVKPLGIRSAFEVGCHSGELLAVLADQGARVAGIELTEELIERARMFVVCQGFTGSWYVGDFRSFAERRKYSLVFSSGFIEHFTLDDQVEMLRKMGTISKRFVLTLAPNKHCEAYRRAKVGRPEWALEDDYSEEMLATIHAEADLFVLRTGKIAGGWAKRFGPEPSEPYLVWCLARPRPQIVTQI